MQQVRYSALATGLATLLAPPLLAQSAQRAIFVANNGNLEGSVTSYTLDPNGYPVFGFKFVTGTRPPGSTFDAGTNAYSISLSPDGKFLAVGHATSSNTVERLSILRVQPDATLLQGAFLETPDSPLDCQWLRNDTLAVTLTSTSGANKVIAYHFEDVPDVGPVITEIDREDTGLFTTALALHPNGDVLYAQDSSGFKITAFAINANGTLTPLGSQPTSPLYPLGIGVTPDGRWLFAGGGISGDGKSVIGYAIDPNTGLLAAVPGIPFISPGSSPKQVIGSPDSRFAVVGHGTDATARVFSIDPNSGALTYTGFALGVGDRGLGDMAFLGDVFYVTRKDSFSGNPTGLLAYRFGANGSFTSLGPVVGSQGTGPTYMAVWDPPAGCPGDADGNGVVNQDDIDIVLFHFGQSVPPSTDGDLDGDGDVDQDDVDLVLFYFGSSCP